VTISNVETGVVIAANHELAPASVTWQSPESSSEV